MDDDVTTVECLGTTYVSEIGNTTYSIDPDALCHVEHITKVNGYHTEVTVKLGTFNEVLNYIRTTWIKNLSFNTEDKCLIVTDNRWTTCNVTWEVIDRSREWREYATRVRSAQEG